MKIEVIFMKGGNALPEADEDENAAISIIWDKLKKTMTLDSGSLLIHFRGEDKTEIGQDDKRTLKGVNFIFSI